MNYDIKIFQLINNLAGHSKILDKVAIFAADYLPYLLGIFLIFFLFWPKRERIKNIMMVFFSIMAALIARVVVKGIIVFFYERPRPYISLSSTKEIGHVDSNEDFQSFPSGHTIFFFALSAVVYGFNKKLGTFFFVCSAIIGFARIFVGLHWPSDILGGAVLGILVGWVVYRFYKMNENYFNNLIKK